MGNLLIILLTLGAIFLIQTHAITDRINTTAPLILQQRPLHNCQLKVGFGGAYLCGNTSYFMGDISSIQSYSTLKLSFLNTLDVDSDQEYRVLVLTDKLQVYKEMNQIVHGDVANETPLMIRIKKRSQYICVVMLSQLPPHELELHNQTSSRFLLRTFIIDQLVNVHEIDFPDQNLALGANSFLGLALLEDRTFGREYILVALKPNWVYIAKTFYQDAEIEESALVKLQTDYQIVDFLSQRDYLFILSSHPATNQLKVSIYRIQDFNNEIKLHNQCEITIPNQPTSDLKPSLKVKNIRNLYIFAVNLPGDEILVYHFQETWYNKLTNQCPEQGPSIKYADYQIQGQYGYSFDFVIIPARVSVLQGFLLTPISNQVNSSVFITYCFPNHYLLSTTGVCVPCRESSSPGGPAAQCKECEIDNLHTFVQPYDPYQGTCPAQCKQNGKFGPQCSACGDYMNSLNLNLPVGAYWSVDTNLQCNLFCKEGFADLTTGTCLTQQQNEIKLNNCEQLKDCYNCSLSLHCTWKNATCQSFAPVSGHTSKSQFITDFIEPGLSCKEKAVCGPALPFSDMGGTIELGGDFIGKNQVCAWEITVPEGKFRDILVSVNATGLNAKRADNPNIIFVTCCMLYKSTRRCQIQAFPIKNNARNITCAGGNFAYLIYWNRKSSEGALDSFRINYNISTSSAFGDWTELIESFIERVFKWFVSFLVFLSIFSALTRLQARRIRRRFLVELQEMGNFDELNQSEQDHEPINIQEVLENDRLVSRVSYHENILNEYQQSECPICLEEFKIKESLVRLNCKHLFHIKCFEDWAAAANNNHIKCPVCNNVLI